MHRILVFLGLLLTSGLPMAQSPGQDQTLILADPGDPY